MQELFAQVIIDIAHEDVDKLFTYALGDVRACVGQRVLVPFGKGNSMKEGFVLAISDIKPNIEVKQVIRTLEDYPIIDEVQLTLCTWIKNAYHCTMAQTLRLMMPAQLRGLRVHEKTVRTYSIACGVDVPMLLMSMEGRDGSVKAKKQYELIKLLNSVGMPMPSSDISAIIPNASSVLSVLVERGIVSVSEQTVFRRPLVNKSTAEHKITLTAEQSSALSRINACIDSGYGSFLLHGVTGSGKTEVYLRAIEHALADGKGAIVLVPEISLTPQTVERFVSRFGNRVAVLHCRLSAGERFDEWRRIRSGEATVVVGARSAVFAPVHRLGVLVIDEEHENSYSSDSVAPRYNAIEIAQKRCSLSSAVLILGSATPSITTYFWAKHGKYELLELNNRTNDMPLPNVEIVDMRPEFLAGNTGAISTCLQERLKECISAGEQAILFINRRGYSNFVTCRACGHSFKCENCDISLTYHKIGHKMKCHYCGDEKPIPTICPVCKKPYIKYNGVGTQQVEEEFATLFPNVATLRMDTDTTSTKDAHTKILSEFASGSVSVLIGTQMIAKGLDFPNVTLVGVISADSLLNVPDYRNTERAYQLLTQVSGRAGRAKKAGHVVIQTNTPEHTVIEFAKNQDYRRFYDYAIAERLSSFYPPYSIFVRILFVGVDGKQEDISAEAVSYADGVYSALTSMLISRGSTADEILSIYAMPAPIKKIMGNYRHEVLIKLARTKNLNAMIHAIYSFSDSFEKTFFKAVEINPSEMT